MVFNEKQIDSAMCDGVGCGNHACFVYSTDKDPFNLIQACLDCNRRDYGGFSEDIKDIPLEVLPTSLRDKMLDKCASRDTRYDHGNQWPDLPTGDVVHGGRCVPPLPSLDHQQAEALVRCTFAVNTAIKAQRHEYKHSGSDYLYMLREQGKITLNATKQNSKAAQGRAFLDGCRSEMNQR